MLAIFVCRRKWYALSMKVSANTKCLMDYKVINLLHTWPQPLLAFNSRLCLVVSHGYILHGLLCQYILQAVSTHDIMSFISRLICCSWQSGVFDVSSCSLDLTSPPVTSVVRLAPQCAVWGTWTSWMIQDSQLHSFTIENVLFLCVCVCVWVLVCKLQIKHTQYTSLLVHVHSFLLVVMYNVSICT